MSKPGELHGGRQSGPGLFEFLSGTHTIPYVPGPMQCDFPDMMNNIFDPPTITKRGAWTDYEWKDGTKITIQYNPLLDGCYVTKPIKQSKMKNIIQFLRSRFTTTIETRTCQCGRPSCKGGNPLTTNLTCSFKKHVSKIKTELALDSIQGKTVKIISDEPKRFEYSIDKKRTIIRVV